MLERNENTLLFEVSQTPVFDFNIRFFDKSEIKLYLEQDNGGSLPLISGIDFSVEDKDDYSDGAKITLNIGSLNLPVLPSGKKLAISRILPLHQTLNLPENGKIPSTGLEIQLDRIVMQIQQLADQLGRSISVPPTSEGNLNQLIDEIKAVGTASKQHADSAADSATVAADSATVAADSAEIVAAALQKSAGVPIGSIFSFPASIPPEGAYLLNGQTVANCSELYPKFWQWVNTAGVRIIDNATFEAEKASAGVCGGFVVDTEGGSVRLPDIVNGTLWGADGGTIGQSLAAGLPNITGTLYMTDSYSSGHADGTNGAFSLSKVSGSYMDDNGIAGTRTNAHFDASLSNSVYGNSDTVQPPAVRVSWCIQVYNAATALSEQESAQLASKMQLKAQTDLANVNSNIDYVVESWSDGTGGWYRKYRSGWVEQGGYSPQNISVSTITLWVEMADANYSALASYSLIGTSTDSGGATTCPMVSDRTTTTIRMNQNKKSTDSSYWEVKGYAATE